MAVAAACSEGSVEGPIRLPDREDLDMVRQREIYAKYMFSRQVHDSNTNFWKSTMSAADTLISNNILLGEAARSDSSYFENKEKWILMKDRLTEACKQMWPLEPSSMSVNRVLKSAKHVRDLISWLHVWTKRTGLSDCDVRKYGAFEEFKAETYRSKSLVLQQLMMRRNARATDLIQSVEAANVD